MTFHLVLVVCVGARSELDFSATPSSASSRRRSVANSWESRARGLGTSTSTSSEIEPSVSTITRSASSDRLVDVVGDQQHGRRVAATQIQQQAVHLDPGQRVERAERFVEQQQFGFAHQRTGQRDALRLSAGQRPRPHLGLVGRGSPRSAPPAPAPAPPPSTVGRRSRWSARAATAAAGDPGRRWPAGPAPGGNRSKSPSSAPSARRNVLLPDPLRPSIATNSPRGSPGRVRR